MIPTRSLLLAVLFVACVCATETRAAPVPALFKLSISGTAHAEWDHTGAPVTTADCVRTIRSEGIRDVRFKSAAPTVIRVAGGRLSTVTVRRLVGTVVLAGANTTSDVCGAERREVIADCAQTTRRFGAATIAVAGGHGSLTLHAVRNARLRASTCPREPADVVRMPAGPIPGPLKVSTATLANERVVRIRLTASKSRRIRYGPIEAGTLTHRSAWTLTLERVAD
ncbi:MAG: hypothetical protein ACJ74D_00280 [Gaiellaceae bacterium]